MISLHIGADSKHRTWKLRVHLLPGERLSHQGIALDGKILPTTVQRPLAAGAASESRALIAAAPVHDSVADDKERHYLQRESVVEAVVRGSQYEQTIQFEVIA
jgi:hypothetical protein